MCGRPYLGGRMLCLIQIGQPELLRPLRAAAAPPISSPLDSTAGRSTWGNAEDTGAKRRKLSTASMLLISSLFG